MEELWRKSTNTAFKTVNAWNPFNTVTWKSTKKNSQTSQASQTSMCLDVHSISGCMWRLLLSLLFWCCFSAHLAPAVLAAASTHSAGRSNSAGAASADLLQKHKNYLNGIQIIYIGKDFQNIHIFCFIQMSKFIQI